MRCATRALQGAETELVDEAGTDTEMALIDLVRLMG